MKIESWRELSSQVEQGRETTSQPTFSLCPVFSSLLQNYISFPFLSWLKREDIVVKEEKERTHPLDVFDNNEFIHCLMHGNFLLLK